MNNKEFNKLLAERVGRSQKDTAAMLDVVVGAMRENFKQGEPVMITNFGIFEVKKKQQRTIVNPTTKNEMIVPEKLKLAFKPIAALKEKINAKTIEE